MPEMIIAFVLLLLGALLVMFGATLLWDGIERLTASWRVERWRKGKR